MAVETDSRIGTEIAGYRIEALIGRGGMSAVYRAEDLTLGRKVALKLISPELSEDESFRDRFRAEWRLAASIDHPNVIPIYEAGEFDGTLFIAMRYVEGTDLKALLEEEGALEPTRALNLVSQAGAGLDAAHHKGLVHRDVKPSNVLVSFDRDGEHAYLADFGLTKPASTAEEARESIQLSGTTDYVSPEQIADGTADARSDIYGLGALLYETLTGVVPYPGDRKLQVLFAHVNDPPPKPTEARPELPEALDSVIAKAMAKEPEDRYSTGAELAEAAAAAFPEPKRPRWQLAALVGVLALLIAAAIAIPAIVLTGGSEETEPSGTTEITSHSVQRIDPETGELAATLELGFIPEDLAAGGAGVWLLDRREQTVAHLSTGTNTVAETVEFEAVENDLDYGRLPKRIFVSESAIWAGALWAYQPTNGSSSRLAIAPYFIHPFVVDADEVWAFDNIDAEPAADERFRNGVLRRFDSRSGEMTAEVPVEADGISVFSEDNSPIWIDEESVWVLANLQDDEGLGTRDRKGLFEVDRETNTLVYADELPIEKLPRTIGSDERYVWIPSPNEDSLIRLDRANGQFVTIRVGRQPVAVALANGEVWVANERDGTVSRVDPESLDVRTIELGGTTTDIAANDDGVWVTVRPR